MYRVTLALSTGLLAAYDADSPHATPLFHIAVVSLAMPLLHAAGVVIMAAPFTDGVDVSLTARCGAVYYQHSSQQRTAHAHRYPAQTPG
jgi:hypothetical protein